MKKLPTARTISAFLPIKHGIKLSAAEPAFHGEILIIWKVSCINATAPTLFAVVYGVIEMLICTRPV